MILEFDHRENPRFERLTKHIVLDFWVFHAKHPEFFRVLTKFANEGANAIHRPKLTMDMIWDRALWYMNIESEIPYYPKPRKFMPPYRLLLSVEDKRFDDLLRGDV